MSVNALSPRSGGVIGTIGPIGGRGVWSLRERGLLAQDFFDDVSLLLHMNGSNGSTTFTDSSSNAHTVTAGGGAAISTAQSKFGGASGLFANGTFVDVPDSEAFAFGTGDYTIETWIYPTSYGTAHSGITRGTICSQWTSAGGYAFNLSLSSTGQILFFQNFPSSIEVFTGSSEVSLNVWTHIAAVRTGSTFYVFINGVQKATATSSNAANNSSALFVIGRNNDANVWYFVGHIDDLRVTKGVARYTGNFTPPQRQFRP